jgi:hypothetical protein
MRVDMSRRQRRAHHQVPTCFPLAFRPKIPRYRCGRMTVVFENGMDIYFARKLVMERLFSIQNDSWPTPRRSGDSA